MTVKELRSFSEDSIGIVETQYYTINEKIVLESGGNIGPVTIAYETYGKLNETKDNAILVLHALTGDAHAAGYNSADEEKPGWWDMMIGPGKAFDTNNSFVICSNILGGCSGTTGPSSINPLTNRPYGIDFPVITIEDTVKVQKKLIEHLGVEKLLSVAGGSMGECRQCNGALCSLILSILLLLLRLQASSRRRG